jgi:predicted DsbA family dithiol-disulfide isomerase
MRVEIWSDVVCPWCYIGKRRFEQALAAFAHRDEVEVHWRSFELDPSAPAERTGGYAENLAAKYGRTVPEAQQMLDGMTATAAVDGLTFDFGISRPGSTFDAHRLLHLAQDRGVQDAVKERLLRATFTEGEPIGDHATLVRLVADAGVEADEARAVLASDRYAAECAPTSSRLRRTASAGCRSSSSTAGTACPGPSRQRRSAGCSPRRGPSARR